MVGIPGASLAQLHVGTTLPVAEIFGPTIQGEGPHTGRRCWFLRLGDCNLHCSWCDTKFTWDWANHDRAQEIEDLTAEQIGDRLHALGANRGDIVVVTGGEPLIHYNKPAFAALLRWGFRWHLESNGTIWPGEECALAFDHVTLSVKIAQDDDPAKRRIKPKVIAKWLAADRWAEDPVAWKFVVRDRYDLSLVTGLVNDHAIPRDTVWIMPEGTTPYSILRTQAALADAVIGAGFNISTRLHDLLWPDNVKGR